MDKLVSFKSLFINNNLLRGHSEGLDKHVKVIHYDNVALILPHIFDCWENDELIVLITGPDYRRYCAVYGSDLVHKLPENKDGPELVEKYRTLKYYSDQVALAISPNDPSKVSVGILSIHSKAPRTIENIMVYQSITDTVMGGDPL